MEAAVASIYFILLVTISSTIAFPLAKCPESAAATVLDSPTALIPSVEPVMNSNNDNISQPDAPLMPPHPAEIAAAPAQQDAGPTVTNGVQPVTQPSAVSVGTASSSTNINGNGNQGEEELGKNNQDDENTSNNSQLAGGGGSSIGGGVMAEEPLVDNTPFDSGSSTNYGFMRFYSYIVVILWILI